MLASRRRDCIQLFLYLFVLLNIALIVQSTNTRWRRSPQQRDQIFEWGKSSLYFWNERKMYLEELASKRDPWPQTQLQELGMSFFVASESQGTPDQVYGRAIANLKQAAPNLQMLWLIGGYHFNPQWKTYNSLYNEILFVMENLRALTKHLQNSKFRIYSHSRDVPHTMNSIRFMLLPHMTREFLRQGYHLRIMQELLGHHPSHREIHDRYFIIIKEINGIKVYIELGFFTDESSEKVPLGRTRFVEGQVENLIID